MYIIYIYIPVYICRYIYIISKYIPYESPHKSRKIRDLHPHGEAIPRPRATARSVQVMRCSKSVSSLAMASARACCLASKSLKRIQEGIRHDHHQYIYILYKCIYLYVIFIIYNMIIYICDMLYIYIYMCVILVINNMIILYTILGHIIIYDILNIYTIICYNDLSMIIDQYDHSCSFIEYCYYLLDISSRLLMTSMIYLVPMIIYICK